MGTKLSIMMDMDGVLVDFIGECLRWDDLPVMTEISEYDFWAELGIERPSEYDAVFNIFADALDHAPMADLADDLHKCDAVDLHIVSTPLVDNSLASIVGKRSWLSIAGLGDVEASFVDDKAAIAEMLGGFDVIIEDNPEVALSVALATADIGNEPQIFLCVEPRREWQDLTCLEESDFSFEVGTPAEMAAEARSYVESWIDCDSSNRQWADYQYNVLDALAFALDKSDLSDDPVKASIDETWSAINGDPSAKDGGEVTVVSSTGGKKGSKPERHDLIPSESLSALARHYARGAEKYDRHNWRKGYDWSLSYAALQRHALAWLAGEDFDGETGSHHMAAVAFHAFALIYFAEHERYVRFDDRYRA